MESRIQVQLMQALFTKGLAGRLEMVKHNPETEGGSQDPQLWGCGLLVL